MLGWMANTWAALWRSGTWPSLRVHSRADPSGMVGKGAGCASVSIPRPTPPSVLQGGAEKRKSTLQVTFLKTLGMPLAPSFLLQWQETLTLGVSRALRPQPAERGHFHSHSQVGPENQFLNVTVRSHISQQIQGVTLGPNCNLWTGVSALIKLKCCLLSTSCLRFLPKSVECFKTFLGAPGWFTPFSVDSWFQLWSGFQGSGIQP